MEEVDYLNKLIVGIFSVLFQIYILRTFFFPRLRNRLGNNSNVPRVPTLSRARMVHVRIFVTKTTKIILDPTTVKVPLGAVEQTLQDLTEKNERLIRENERLLIDNENLKIKLR